MHEFILRLMKGSDEGRSESTPLILSHFDRVSWEEVQDDGEYSSLESIGDCQIFHVYDLDIHAKNGDGFLFHGAELNMSSSNLCVGMQPYLFLGMCIISLTDFARERAHIKSGSDLKAVIQSKNYGYRLRHIADDLNQVVEHDGNLRVCWCGSQGEEDLLLILASDTLDSIIQTIEKIRQRKYKMVGSDAERIVEYTYSFVIPNLACFGKKDIRSRALGRDIGLTASLVVDGEPSEISQWIDDLNGEKHWDVMSCHGKYDLMITIKHAKYGDILSLCERGKLLDNPFIIQSKTILNYQYNNIQSEINIEDFAAPDAHTTPCIDGLFKEVEKRPLFARNRELHRSFARLCEDFRRCADSTFAQYWSVDLGTQLQTFITCLRESSEYANEETLAIFQELLQDFHQQILYINQSSRLLMDIPTSSLQYNGGYNKILRACYGMVKAALCIGYNQARYEGYVQDRIIPIISFHHVPTIYSQIMFDTTRKPGIASGAPGGFRDRLVDIHMPFAALEKLHLYIPYLLHEVFHYICPSDRGGRNVAALRVWLKRYCEVQIERVIRDMESVKLTSGNYVLYVSVLFGLRLNSIQEKIDDEIYTHISEENIFLDFNSLHRLFLTELPELPRLVWEVLECISNISDEELDSITEARVSPLFRAELRQIVAQLQLLLKIEYTNFLRDYGSEVSSDEKTSLGEEIRGIYLGMCEASADIYMCTLLGFIGPDLDKKLEGLKKYLEILATELYQKGQEVGDYLGVKFDGGMSGDKKYLVESNTKLSVFIRVGMVVDYLMNYDRIRETSLIKAEIHALVQDITNVEDEYQQFLVHFINMALEVVYDKYCQIMHWSRDQLYQLCCALYKRPSDTKECDEPFRYIQQFRSFFSSDKNGKELDILLMERFQHQTTLEEVYSSYARKPELGEWHRPGWLPDVHFAAEEINVLSRWVWSFAEYIHVLPKCVSTIANMDNTDTRGDIVWYRGIENVNYDLTSSLFREIKDDSTPPMVYLLGLNEVFESKSYNASELNGFREIGQMGRLATMQHYSVPTPLLDWSENGITALYFAAVPFKTIGKEPPETGAQHASVFLLNPLRMNEAKLRMQDWSKYHKGHRGESPDEWFAKGLTSTNSYPLFNLNDKLEAQRFWQYALPDTENRHQKFVDRWEKNKKMRKSLPYEDGFPGGYEDTLWPIAVLGGSVNPRIRAQQGVFTAVNLTSCLPERLASDPDAMDKEKNRQMDYLSITNMQIRYKKFLRYFRENCTTNKEQIDRLIQEENFLFKLKLRKECLVSIEKQLTYLGFSDMHVYPDLERIGSDVTKRLRGYYSNL